MIEYNSCGAKISRCSQYRYDLWRYWERDRADNPDNGYVLFIGLNPSTADAITDDNTVKKCRGFTERLGYSKFHMANLFAYRATKPEDLYKHSAPIGMSNNKNILRLAEDAKYIICAWGNDGKYRYRDFEVCELLKDFKLHCLATTQQGRPWHPLYLSYAKGKLQEFNLRGYF